MEYTAVPAKVEGFRRFVCTKQDRLFTYIVTLKRVCATIVAVESSEYNMFQVWVCSLNYGKRMLHIVIRGLSGCTIFLHTARLLENLY